MPVVIGYAQSVSVTATDIAPVTADAIEELTECSLSSTVDTAEGFYLGGDGYRRVYPTKTSIEISLAGHLNASDTSQGVLRTAHKAKTVVYLYLTTNAAATAGQEKSIKYVCYVTSYEESRPSEDVISFSATLMVQGAPVSVNAP